jgi:hypothetical protein
MDNKIPTYLEKKVQFKDELFFQYLWFFTEIKLNFSNQNKLWNSFFDIKNKTLTIPKNPNFNQIKIIISFLNKYTKYNLWITAKKRLENSKTQLSLLKLNNLENSLLRESLYENWKKYVLESMIAPKSNKLLKDEIKLDILSWNFNNLSLYRKKKEINKILWLLSDYPDANIKTNDWWLPLNFIRNKKMYCVWYSYLADIIFEKLNIKHFVATWLKINNIIKRNVHSVSVIILDWKYFLFDPTALLTWTLFLKKINVINKKFNYKDYSFSLWSPETEVLAQNIWNFSQEKYLKSEKIKLLEYALKLSPNNILIKIDLKKIKR